MRSSEKAFLFAFCFFIFSALVTSAQVGIVDQNAKLKPTIVVLGTYHMGTSGNNVVNGKVDDVTKPERQKQIVELIERLKKFKPTKIMVECRAEDEAKIQENYGKYLSENYQLSKNEINQIGFRLGKDFGHKRIYCIDSGGFWDESAMNYEKYASKDAELDKFLKETYRNLKKRIDAENEKMLSLSVTDQLILLNQADRIEKDHQWYFELMRIGRDKEYIGANYFAWWYGRNMQILTNIIRATDSMNDRILVIYGAGHAKLLNQLAKESEFYKVENPLEYLKGRK